MIKASALGIRIVIEMSALKMTFLIEGYMALLMLGRTTEIMLKRLSLAEHRERRRSSWF